MTLCFNCMDLCGIMSFTDCAVAINTAMWKCHNWPGVTTLAQLCSCIVYKTSTGFTVHMKFNFSSSLSTDIVFDRLFPRKSVVSNKIIHRTLFSDRRAVHNITGCTVSPSGPNQHYSCVLCSKSWTHKVADLMIFAIVCFKCFRQFIRGTS